MLLGVNIDHVATVRQARRTNEPDPVHAAVLAELGGADQITVHLREDRRHIQDRDVRLLRETIKVPLNFELGLSEEIIKIALDTQPDSVCIVPEKREEITTEGGLDVVGHENKIRDAIAQFHNHGIDVSLFIDPDDAQVLKAIELGADTVELHTGRYASATGGKAREEAVRELANACELVFERLGQHYLISMERNGDTTAVPPFRPRIDLGHGLTYRNLHPLLISLLPNPLLDVLNIGHSIVSRAMLVGMTQAVRDMKESIHKAEIAAHQMHHRAQMLQIDAAISNLEDAGDTGEEF